MKTATFLGAIALAVTAPVSAQVVLNTSSWMPHSHVLVAGITMPLCDDIKSATQGRVRCNLLPKPVVAAPQTFDAVRDGVADLSFIVDGYTPGRFLLSKVAEFPFLGDTAEATSVAYQRIYEKYFARHNEHAGVKVLGVFTHGPGQLFTANRQIRSVDDLSGLKIRTGGGLVNDVIKSIGGTGMLKAAPEVYELMSSGIIDGFVFPKETANSLKLIPTFKYVTEVPGGLYNVSFSMIANPAKWNQISPEDQKAIQKLLGEPLARRAGRAWDAADGKGVEAMRAAGIVMSTAPQAMVEEIRKRTAHLESQWAESLKVRGVDGIAALTELRKEIQGQQIK